jgi:uncharacterized protein
VVAARPVRIVWLGAIGTGGSVGAVGRLTAVLLRAAFGAEYHDKVAAETTVLAAGGTVLHSDPFSDKADDRGTHARPLAAAGRRFFPHGTPRATIARLMLDEAGAPSHAGQIIVRSQNDASSKLCGIAFRDFHAGKFGEVPRLARLRHH